MDDLERIFLEPNTIIDLVVPPGMDLEPVIFRLLDKSKDIFVIDTQGQINLYINSHVEETSLQERFRNVSDQNGYIFASSIGEIYTFIDRIMSCRNFILIFDSITFICDISPENIKRFANILWNVIYNCNASVITINHFKIDSDKKRRFRLTPRMGSYWKKIVSFQVEFFSMPDNIKCKIYKNNILAM